MRKKKVFILGTAITGVLVGAPISLIIIIKNINSNKDKEDVEAIIKILKNIKFQNKILKISSDSIGKIIANKDNNIKIIKKIQKLINISKLRRVSIGISMIQDANISTIEQAIIVKISKGEHWQEFKGIFGLKVKREKTIKEIKIEKIKIYLVNTENLSLKLPKTTYNNDTQILAAIRTKLIDIINDVESSDIDLITKKDGENEVVEVASHNELATLYSISVDEEDFVLKLNQEKYNPIDTSKIHDIKNYLKTKNNLNFLLPKDLPSNYNQDSKIFAAIKKTFVSAISTIDNADFDIWVTKKENEGDVVKVASHNELATLYSISVDEEDFVLKLNQEKYNQVEKNKINAIKTYLENPTNLNFKLPKTESSNYDQDAKILAAIKKTFVNAISTIDNADFDIWVTKKENEGDVVKVASHNELATSYSISVDEEDFVLKLNQEKYNQVEKNKIDYIKNYLKIENNLNLKLPKTESSNYDQDAKILVAIKNKLATNILNIEIENIFLITKKEGTSDIVKVASHNELATSYSISVDEEDFVLKLNQEKYNQVEKNKIINIKNYLKIKNNLNLKLPIILSYEYDQDGKVLAAIKKILVSAISIINDDDFDIFITKKEGTSDVVEVATHGATATQYIITIDEQDFILSLNQANSYAEEYQIDFIKEYLNAEDNKNLILPKAIAFDYNQDSKVLAAIKKILVSAISIIDDDDFDNLITKKENEGDIVKVAAHGATTTQYAISVGESNFNLNLNQARFYKNEYKTKSIKEYLKNNEKLILPKTIAFDYNQDSKIFAAIKKILVANILAINNIDFDFFVTKKEGFDVVKVATHDATATQYIITIDEQDFILSLNQANSYTKEYQIDFIKKYLNVEDNKKLILPKAITSDYDQDSKVLAAIKKILVSAISIIDDVDFDNLIIKKENESFILKVATYGATATQYIITIDEQDFILSLNQANSYTREYQIDSIKKYLNVEDNKNLILPKAITSNYNQDSKVLAAIKKIFFAAIPTINNADFDNLIIKKENEGDIVKVAAHGATATQYAISVGESNFNLNLNQANSYTREYQIDFIKKYLNIEDNKNLILPKAIAPDYDQDSKVLAAIKKILVTAIPIINDDDFDIFITKKEGTSDVVEVATHSASATQYAISVGESNFNLNLNQANSYTREYQIDFIKKYLNIEDNKNLILPKAIAPDYDQDSKVLATIKKILVSAISTINDDDFDNLIIKKENEDDIVRVAPHNELATSYSISVDEEDFVLKLNQEKYIESKKRKIKDIKTYLKNLANLNLRLPKVIKTSYDSDAKILAAIKVKLATISKIGNVGANLITKKADDVQVVEVAIHDEKATEYKITIDENNFTLKLNQEKYNQADNNKINDIKNYLKIKNNLNLRLPKALPFDYNRDIKILAAIKKIFVAAIPTINNVDFDNLIIKKENEADIIKVAAHAALATQYAISVGSQNFILSLNQVNSYTREYQIDSIKKYLNDEDNKNLILPKAIASDYDQDSKVLAAIKKILVSAISIIDDVDFDNLIIKKENEADIIKVAAHGATTTQYIITIDEQDFILKLNQANSYTREYQIDSIKKYLNDEDNKNLILPKAIASNYDQDSKVLAAIKKILVSAISTINDDDFDNLIIKKENKDDIIEVAIYDVAATIYWVSIGDQDFILKLNQATSYTREYQIEFIKNNLNLKLPKTTYSNDAQILAAIKNKLATNILNIEIENIFLITKKEDEDDIIKVAAYGATATPYAISVGGEDFILKLNQEKYTNEEKENKITNIKTYLTTINNLNLKLPKVSPSDYDQDSKVLAAIKKILVSAISTINDDDDFDIFITKKEGTSDVVEVATHSVSATQYAISVGGEDFTLKLNQVISYTLGYKIQIVQKYLNNRDSLLFILPKDSGLDYDQDAKILATIRNEILGAIPEIQISETHFIRKKSGKNITSVSTIASTATQYEIYVYGISYNLRLAQAIQYKSIRKIKSIKSYFENEDNKNLRLPKVIAADYNQDSKVLAAIKKILVTAIPIINDDDFEIFITKKEGTNDVVEVATHGTTATQYAISVVNQNFILSLNQATSYTKEYQIDSIKKYLNNSNNLNLKLPKTESSNYDQDSKVFAAIKKILIADIIVINEINFDSLITKKEDDGDFIAVPTYGESPTLYSITFNKNNFVLKLNQKKYEEEEIKRKTYTIKSYFENENNLNLRLPKALPSDYDQDSKVLAAIKKILVSAISTINDDDDFDIFITKKEGTSDVVEVATHSVSATQYAISVGEQDFILSLNQAASYTREYQIDSIKKYLNNSNNLNLKLPKIESSNYDQDSEIFAAIKKILIADIIVINEINFDSLITKKEDDGDFIAVPTYGEPPTLYSITFNKNNFVLRLNQKKYSEEKEKTTVLKITEVLKSKILIVNSYASSNWGNSQANWISLLLKERYKILKDYKLIVKRFISDLDGINLKVIESIIDAEATTVYVTVKEGETILVENVPIKVRKSTILEFNEIKLKSALKVAKKFTNINTPLIAEISWVKPIFSLNGEQFGINNKWKIRHLEVLLGLAFFTNVKNNIGLKVFDVPAFVGHKNIIILGIEQNNALFLTNPSFSNIEDSTERTYKETKYTIDFSSPKKIQIGLLFGRAFYPSREKITIYLTLK